ncbi:zona pellucida-binding protein 1-like [Elgaria multicarinata webbii]|uniref:zona pellucida-binding protein 1-like n=1 Tax=Elgaria multicarinata webbii TaxID=159646 RepID=UPI002FCD2102
MKKIIDPKYQWTGPLGRITKESQRFVLSDYGSLEIYNIKGSDSGSYTCRLNYIFNGDQLTTEIHFMIYVYHMPRKSIHLSSKFTIGTCENNAIVSFEKYLLENLESLIYDLGCEIKQWSTQCHASTDTVEKIKHKLTFQFVVFPLVLTAADLCRSSQCENSMSDIKKAYGKIKQFFEVQNTDSSHSDHIRYIPGSLTGVKVDHCKPGFGKNINAINNDTMCPGCCVTCPPGTFSAKYGTICILCPAGSYNEKYGQAVCENCPEAQSSDEKGAKTERKCHSKSVEYVAKEMS